MIDWMPIEIENVGKGPALYFRYSIKEEWEAPKARGKAIRKLREHFNIYTF